MKRIQWTETQLKRIRHLLEVDKIPQHDIRKAFPMGENTLTRLIRRHGWQSCSTGPRRGELHPGWKGGRHLDKSGYVLVYQPDHPYARRMGYKNSRKYVLEHRLVVEQHLGRTLTRQEVVHHKNGDRTDNRLENLELFDSNPSHLAKTLLGKIPNWTPEGRARMTGRPSRK